MTMSKVYCTGITCKYNANGMCTRESINLDDFEYFLSADDKKKDISCDDMKCSSYEYDKFYSERNWHEFNYWNKVQAKLPDE